MSELSTKEAVGLLETEGTDVTADTLRALAKTNRIAARKEGGEWRFPETVVSDVQRVQEEESQPEEAQSEEGDSGGGGARETQKYDQAAEEGRRQAERESDPGRNARLDTIFGR